MISIYSFLKHFWEYLKNVKCVNFNILHQNPLIQFVLNF